MKKTTIDKSNWKKVTFGDVASELKTTVRDIKEELEYYIGLDHIDPENLHISRWGNLAEGVSFTKVFKKGQILFGRRRAYQKKAAIAPFNGVCSGDILVFEPKANKIDPSFFPFLIQNDNFFDFAMKTSAGSLSPRTKFKDLAKFEFLLPPLKQQKELAGLLCSGDELVNTYKVLRKKLEVNLDTAITNRIKNTKYQEIEVGDLLVEKPTYGASKKAVEYISGKPRYIRITDFDENGTLRDETKMTIHGDDYDKYKVNHNDILLARTADPGKSFLFKDSYGESVYAGYLIKFVFNQKLISPDFFYIYTKTSNYWSQINKRQKKGTLSNINASQFQSIRVMVPELKKQEVIVDEYYSQEKLVKDVIKQVALTTKLHKSLINQIFE